MNIFFNLIPTPKTFEYEGGLRLKIKTVSIVGKASAPIPAALNVLKKDLDFTVSDVQADLTVYTERALFPKELITDNITKLFEEKFAVSYQYLYNIKPQGNPAPKGLNRK